MKGLKSNILYWGYTLECLLFVMLGTLALINIITGLNDITNFYGNALEWISSMGLSYMFLMMCMVAFHGAASYLPFTISMGSTRKASFIAMQIMMHLLEVQLGAIVMLANAILGQADQFGGSVFYTLAVHIVVMLVSIAVANFISAVIMKFGRGAGVAAYFGMLLFGVIVVALLWIFKPIALLKVLFQGIIPISIILDIISIAIYYKVVKNVEVRV